MYPTHEMALARLSIEKEAGLLGNKCRFIAKLIACFQCNLEICFFMEFLNGGTLYFHFLKQEIFPEKYVVFYTAEILCGLLFLHRNGIVHRDLKLSNILLDFRGHCKISDFGICKRISNDKTDTITGTNEFIAPEVISKIPYDYAVDFWSLGINVYLMLTGVLPFKDFISILNSPLIDLNCKRIYKAEKYEISACAIDFVKSLLNKNPHNRLGAKTNTLDIKKNEFFRDIDWKKLEKGDLTPPINPNVVLFLNYNFIKKLKIYFLLYFKRSVDDVSNFDQNFTCLNLQNNAADHLKAIPSGLFQGFDYNVKKIMKKRFF